MHNFFVLSSTTRNLAELKKAFDIGQVEDEVVDETAFDIPDLPAEDIRGWLQNAEADIRESLISDNNVCNHVKEVVDDVLPAVIELGDRLAILEPDVERLKDVVHWLTENNNGGMWDGSKRLESLERILNFFQVLQNERVV